MRLPLLFPPLVLWLGLRRRLRGCLRALGLLLLSRRLWLRRLALVWPGTRAVLSLLLRRGLRVCLWRHLHGLHLRSLRARLRRLLAGRRLLLHGWLLPLLGASVAVSADGAWVVGGADGLSTYAVYVFQTEQEPAAEAPSP